METIQCSTPLLRALLEVLVYATRNGHFDEAQALLNALRTLRPNFVELNLTEAWLLVSRHEYVPAAQQLRELLNSPGTEKITPFSSALMALCLNAVGDPEWHVYASEVLAQDADPDSVTLVHTLLGVQQAETEGETARSVAMATAAAALQDSVSDFHNAYHFTRV